MRLEWLEDILAVAETGSFSEAAARRHLTQSAFSRRIRSIEDHLGVELFDRSKKPVQLRPATEDQRDSMRRLAGRLHRLAADLRRGASVAENRVVIASQHALTAALTPAVIERLQARWAELHVRLRSANLDECFAMLLARQADIALVYRVPGTDPPIEADYIETLALGSDRLIPVAAPALAARIEARHAGGELPVVAYPGDVFFGQVMERQVLPRIAPAWQPRAKVETALTFAALELAAAGLGVAWVPASLARGRLAELSGLLPDCPLAVHAVRLAGSTGPVEAAVWEGLAGLGAA